MKTSHTHRGHCQVCDRLHAVDNVTGLLSDHGYTIPAHWHMRNASCVGAKELPYEKSRDVIPRFVKMLKDSAKHFDEQAALLLTFPPREVGTTRFNWTLEKFPDGTYQFKHYQHLDAWARKRGEVGKVDQTLSVQEWYAHLPAEQAAEYTERMYQQECAQLSRNAKSHAERSRADAARWQKRYDSWTSKPLQPK